MNVSSCIVLKKWNYGANIILGRTAIRRVVQHTLCYIHKYNSTKRTSTMLKFYKIGKLMFKIGNYRVTIVTTCCIFLVQMDNLQLA